jgi:predicted phage tail protein
VIKKYIKCVFLLLANERNMTRIELSGVLGKTFGKVHYRLIKNINEAGEALSATIPGFERFMISSEERGLTYAVFKGKKYRA